MIEHLSNCATCGKPPVRSVEGPYELIMCANADCSARPIVMRKEEWQQRQAGQRQAGQRHSPCPYCGGAAIMPLTGGLHQTIMCGNPACPKKPSASDHIAWESLVERVHSLADKAEAIDHPRHYGGADNPYEAIKVIDAWGLGFNLGNTLKYIARAGKKSSTAALSAACALSRLEDLQKARWYLDREI